MRRLLLLVVALQAILLGSLLYQRGASLSDARRQPPPGELFEVGDQLQHIDCRGEGGPTVVLIAGLPRTSIDWRLVQPALAASLRVCAYDRAGYAWSERGPSPRTAERLAQELDILLRQAGEEGPYLLVGQGWGGLVARLLHARRPEQVTGMVLIEAVHPDWVDRMSPAERASWDAHIDRLRELSYLEVLGLTRLARSRLMLEYDELTRLAPLPAEAKIQLETIFVKTGFFRTAYAEASVWPTSFEQVRAAGELGDLPLIVLSAGRATTDLERSLQVELAALSSRGEQRIVEDSDEHIMLFAPEAVIAAIEDLR